MSKIFDSDSISDGAEEYDTTTGVTAGLVTASGLTDTTNLLLSEKLQQLLMKLAVRSESLLPLVMHLEYLDRPLKPIYAMPLQARPHPAFPKTNLHYLLLNEPQLDSLASFYHQRPEVVYDRRTGNPVEMYSIWHTAYPTSMNWHEQFLQQIGCNQDDEEAMGRELARRVWIKRRKFGRFIGLSGCETPPQEIGEYNAWATREQERRGKREYFSFAGPGGRRF